MDTVRMQQRHQRGRRRLGARAWALAALAIMAMLFVAGCNSGDQAALTGNELDSGLTSDAKKQEYTDGVGRALQQLGTASGQSFAKAVDTGNKQQLQAASIAWAQGVEQLKQIDPPKDVLGAHTALVKAVEGLDTWNKKIAAAAPNKARTRKLGRAASQSAISQAYGNAVCAIVDAGYDVADASACEPLGSADQSPAE